MLWPSFSPLSNEFDSLLVRKAIPDAVTGNYNEVVFGLYGDLLDIREGRNLMLFGLFDIPIWATLLWLFHLFLSSRGPFSLLHAAFFLELRQKGWVLVLPIPDGSRHRNNALNTTIFDEATSCFDALQFSVVIWFMIMG